MENAVNLAAPTFALQRGRVASHAVPVLHGSHLRRESEHTHTHAHAHTYSGFSL